MRARFAATLAAAALLSGLLALAAPEPAAALLTSVNVDSGEALDYGSAGPGDTDIQPSGNEATVISSTGILYEVRITGGNATRSGGGGTWTPVASATPGANQYSWRFYKSGGLGSAVYVTTSATKLSGPHSLGATETFYSLLCMPSSYSRAGSYTFSATVTAVGL